MNIIIDTDLHEYLQSITMNVIEFGSKMKGTSTIESDKDLLCIVKTHKSLVVSPIYTGHLLQYKEEGIDYIYTTEQQFVNNIINTESLINHEIYRYNAVKETCLDWIYDIDFDNFKTIKCYLGFARRDLKDCHSLYSKDKRKASKKLAFTNQALDYIYSVYERFGMSYQHKLFDTKLPEVEHKIFSASITEYLEDIENLRKTLAISLDSGKIPYSISDIDFMAIIDEMKDIELLPDNEYSNKILKYYYSAYFKNEYK